MKLKKREYDNQSRQDAAAQNREKIIETCIDMLSSHGLTDFSIGEVARKAGISDRTVYRYFPTRDSLLEEAWQQVLRRTQMNAYPQTEAELLARVPEIFSAMDQHPQLVRSLVLSTIGWEVRMKGDGMRHAGLRKIINQAIPDMPEKDKKRVIGILHVLFSASTWQLLRDRENMTGQEAGETVQWAIRLILGQFKKSGSNT